MQKILISYLKISFFIVLCSFLSISQLSAREWILFSKAVSPNNYGDIFKMLPNGTGIVNITNSLTTDDIYPKVSPEGDKILFTSQKDGDYELYIMDIDGENITQLTKNSISDLNGVWSPDGTQILYHSKLNQPNLPWELYIMDNDGSNIQQLTTGQEPLHSCSIDWGQQGIVFSKANGTHNYGDIFTIQPDGSNLINLTSTNNYEEIWPRISPDGSLITYTSQELGTYDIYTMNYDGSDVNTTISNWISERVSDWSPTGDSLLYLSKLNQSSKPWEFYIINNDGSGNHQISFGLEPKPNFDWAYLADGVNTNIFKIAGIEDVPNDQGRKVRIQWYTHSSDNTDSTNQVAYYTIWRKYDPNLTLHKSSVEWDFIKKIPAVQDFVCSTIAPTLADSNILNGMYYSTFLIRAHTSDNSVHYATEPDSGYSKDNLKPLCVSDFQATLNEQNNVLLRWNENHDSDISHYVIYRDINSDFVPELEVNSIATIKSLEYIDENINNGETYYYKISAIDLNGNESDYSQEFSLNITDIENSKTPLQFKLYQNYPNPFNPLTTIGFTIPKISHVTVEIFNIIGKKVIILENANKQPGYYKVKWNASGYPSGIYMVKINCQSKINSQSFSAFKKMILVK